MNQDPGRNIPQVDTAPIASQLFTPTTPDIQTISNFDNWVVAPESPLEQLPEIDPQYEAPAHSAAVDLFSQAAPGVEFVDMPEVPQPDLTIDDQLPLPNIDPEPMAVDLIHPEDSIENDILSSSLDEVGEIADPIYPGEPDVEVLTEHINETIELTEQIENYTLPIFNPEAYTTEYMQATGLTELQTLSIDQEIIASFDAEDSFAEFDAEEITELANTFIQPENINAYIQTKDIEVSNEIAPTTVLTYMLIQPEYTEQVVAQQAQLLHVASKLRELADIEHNTSYALNAQAIEAAVITADHLMSLEPSTMLMLQAQLNQDPSLLTAIEQQLTSSKTIDIYLILEQAELKPLTKMENMQTLEQGYLREIKKKLPDFVPNITFLPPTDPESRKQIERLFSIYLVALKRVKDQLENPDKKKQILTIPEIYDMMLIDLEEFADQIPGSFAICFISQGNVYPVSRGADAFIAYQAEGRTDNTVLGNLQIDPNEMTTLYDHLLFDPDRIRSVQEGGKMGTFNVTNFSADAEIALAKLDLDTISTDKSIEIEQELGDVELTAFTTVVREPNGERVDRSNSTPSDIYLAYKQSRAERLAREAA